MSRRKIIDIKVIIFILGILLIIVGAFMLISSLFSIYFKGDDMEGIIASSALTLFIGTILFLATKENRRKISKREAYLVVGSSYFVVSLFGCLPYLFSGAIPNFTNAYFETISGFTTTGASILNDIEAVPKGILVWRSLTQWLGGMGMVLLTIAILPSLGIGSSDLFVAEVPGLSKEKLHPRIKETAKRLWYIYLLLTSLLTIILVIEGMSFFDAFNHSLTTLSTGGFSTKNTSIVHFNSPVIEYTLVLFMFLAGVNFTLHYLLMKRKFRDVIKNEELRLYIGFIVVMTIMLTFIIVFNKSTSLENTFREVLFSIVSIVTTTGFVNADYTKWMHLVTIAFFWMLFTGGMAGSTSGGIKVIRHLMMIKNSLLEFKRILHPTAIIPVRFNRYIVKESMIYNIMAFFVIYVVVFIVSSLIVAAAGTTSGSMNILTALSATATSLGNVGPGIGEVGPTENFSHISCFGKWFLGFIMVLGRLELFTVLILFTPYFWSKF